jgi:hypothetical protein
MPTIGDRLRSWLPALPTLAAAPQAPVVGKAAPLATVSAKAALTQAPYAMAQRTAWGVGNDRRRPSRLLRHFADANEWVRVAINRRKSQVSQTPWHIARVDDPQAKPDPRVVKAVGELFRFCNPKRESLRSLLDQVVEDLLVLDAGVIEKEKTLAGKIVALHAVDGATISPDGSWTGNDPKAIRYRQYVDNILRAELRNDQMLYMMACPRTNSPIGWSKIETLVNIIEAELYGEAYDYDMVRQTAPQGLIDLGPGVDPDDVDKFREYYASEIAGTQNMAIVSTGVGDEAGHVKYTPFHRSAREMQRQEYKKWLATKIAAVFEMDLGVFNLTQDIHRSIGEKQERLTDEGHRSLAMLVEEFFTREIVWEFDENHGFRFSNLNARDAMEEAKLRQIYMSIGATTPNEIRAEDGKPPVPWGDEPWPTAMAKAADPAQVDDQKPGDAQSGSGKPAAADDDDDNQDESDGQSDD